VSGPGGKDASDAEPTSADAESIRHAYQAIVEPARMKFAIALCLRGKLKIVDGLRQEKILSG
jgi:hypothetical protein